MTGDWGRLDDRAVGWLDRLLTRDTTSRLSNLPVAELIAEECRTLGITAHLRPDTTGRKANLVATLPAADGRTDGGIALSGHMDTVPVDGQAWSSDPYRPQVRDGRLYARGAADMKGFLALVTAALPRFAAARLAEPVHLAFTFDEELAARGAAQMIGDLAALGVRPRACIVGEPTSMRVITGHKSVTIVRIDVRGRAAHSSLPATGANAVEYAARMCTAFRAITDGWRERGPYDPDYGVPYSTGGIMTIEGGAARNIVPERCTVVLEFRTVPALDPDDVVARLRAEADRLTRAMQAEQPGTGVEVVVEDSVPCLSAADDSPATLAAIAYGGIPSDEHVTYGTDGGAFHAAGIETVICGPGDITQAHGADEYVDITQLEACQDFLATMLDRLSVAG